MPKTLPLEYIETETIAADGKRVITRAKMPKEESSIADTAMAIVAVGCVAYCGYRLVKALSGSDSVPDAALIGGEVVSL